MLVPDPVAIKYAEKEINRKLTPEERLGLDAVYIGKKNPKKFKIPQVNLEAINCYYTGDVT